MPQIDLQPGSLSSSKYGLSFLMLPRLWWERHYDFERVVQHLDSPAFTATEQELLHAVAYWPTWACSPGAVSKTVSVTRRNFQLALKRLALTRVIVNIGGWRRQNLRINGAVQNWELSRLSGLRAEKRKEIHRLRVACVSDMRRVGHRSGILKAEVVGILEIQPPYPFGLLPHKAPNSCPKTAGKVLTFQETGAHCSKRTREEGPGQERAVQSGSAFGAAGESPSLAKPRSGDSTVVRARARSSGGGGELAQPTLEVRNSRTMVLGLPQPLFKLLRYELSYQVGEPGRRVYLQDDGSSKISYWDGFTSLLRPAGWMPSGLVPRALRLLRKWGVDVQVRDLRERPPEGEPRWALAAELRDYQLAAVEAAWAAGRGVIDSPPRSGKSHMIVELVRRVSGPTVVTSPTVQIAKQTYERCLALLGGDQRDFYLLTGGPPDTRKALLAAQRALVFVGTADTARAMSENWWEQIRCLIVDERHHQAAKGYHQLSDLAVNAFYRWGFTGTNFRSEAGEKLALEAVLGEAVAEFSIEDMRARKVLVPARVQLLVMDLAKRMGDRGKFGALYSRGIVRCSERNNLIAAAARDLMGAGRRVLILVERIEHGERLAAMIPGSTFIQGLDGDRIREVTADLDAGQIRCVIGSPVVGEGLDIPAADALIYAKGLRARVTHTQDVFRVMTGGGGKKDALIVDFADRHQGKLLDHSVERMRTYVEMGCSVKVVDTVRGTSVEGGQLGFGPMEAHVIQD